MYAAGDARRGPATVVGGHRRRRGLAEAVIGAPHSYDIPAAAHVTAADATAKKGRARRRGLSLPREGERCLQCRTVCETAWTPARTARMISVTMPDGRRQVIHVDRMCNECGNCTQFCPYASEPCHDKFTLFQTVEDMDDSL